MPTYNPPLRDMHQRLPHRTQVTHTVINDGNCSGSKRHQSKPLVEGILPAARGSASTAMRNARPKALNTVSA